MREQLAAAWNRFWFDSEAPLNLAVTRILLAATALWIVLSRRDLPTILEFPRAIWSTVLPERRLRFLILFDVTTERVLWILLHVVLIALIVGIATRWAALAAGLLLYHFGAMETIIWTGNPYLRGYTIPSLGLLIVAASWSAGAFRGEPSWHHRWPLRLIQVLFAQIYFFSAWAKLYRSGLAWLSAENMRNYIIGIDQMLDIPHTPMNLWIANHPTVAVTMAVCGILIDALFPLVLVSRAARWILLPVAAIFHLANGVIFHIWFQNAPLLLMFVDWRGVTDRFRTETFDRRPILSI